MSSTTDPDLKRSQVIRFGGETLRIVAASNDRDGDIFWDDGEGGEIVIVGAPSVDLSGLRRRGPATRSPRKRRAA